MGLIRVTEKLKVKPNQKLKWKKENIEKITYSIVRVCSCGGRRNGDGEKKMS